MIFIIPWREFSLVGTTDTDFDGDLDRLHATRDEVDYLLGEARKSLPDPRVCREEVVYTYAGVRPLSYEEGTSASKVSRAHRIVAEEGGRFLSITGTKLTCFRSLAEELGDRVSRALGRHGAVSRPSARSTAWTKRSGRWRRARGWTCRARWRPRASIDERCTRW